MSKKYVPPVSLQTFEEHYNLPVAPPVQKELQNLFAGTISALDKIAIGPYMWIISNLSDLRGKVAGGMVEQITGVSAEEFAALPRGASHFAAPEDHESMFGFVHYSLEYRKQFPLERRNQIFFSFYFRFRMEGRDKWMVLKILEESPEKDGVPQYILTMLMDVSHIKKSGVAMMTMFDSSTRKNKIFESAVTNLESDRPVPALTARELDVLKYIANGFSSKMIADRLNISPKTVENHRRNVLLKTKCSTSAEALSLALRNGLL